MVRLKFPFVSQPPAQLQLLRGGQPCNMVEVSVRDEEVLFKIESAGLEHSGHYTILADNGHGEDRIDFALDVEVPPESPGCPEVAEVSAAGQLRLVWEPPRSGPVDHYIIEYYRDQWQLWLRLKTTIDTQSLVTDLIPGSKYKFRVMSASLAGISDPSAASEEVMIGAAADDELFDLPSYSRGRSSSRLDRRSRYNKMPSLERGVSLAGAGAGLGAGRRQTSLDREVYYDAQNVRKEVVTYKPVEVRGTTLSDKYKLSNEELTKYKTSMSELCTRMKNISSSSLVAGRPRDSADSATSPLRREVLSQCRRLGSTSSVAGAGARPGSRGGGDVSECKKSLTDIRDRIGSLQVTTYLHHLYNIYTISTISTRCSRCCSSLAPSPPAATSCWPSCPPRPHQPGVPPPPPPRTRPRRNTSLLIEMIPTPERWTTRVSRSRWVADIPPGLLSPDRAGDPLPLHLGPGGPAVRQAGEQAAAAGEVPRAGHQGRVLSRHHPLHIPRAGLVNVNRWNRCYL